MDKIELQKLIDENNSIYDIAKIYGKSFSATKYWINKHGLKTKFKSFKDTKSTKLEKIESYKKKNPKMFDLGHLEHSKWTDSQQQAYSYILGFYLGDGCLFNRKGQSYTIMIANQADFYQMNSEIVSSYELLFPNKRVTVYKRPNSNCVNIKLTALNLHELFPHGKGSKHTREIQLLDWQNTLIKKYPKDFIKGLIQSDGTRYAPDLKKYPLRVVYQFANCSQDLHKMLHMAVDLLEIAFTFRKTKTKKFAHHADVYLTSFFKRESVKLLDAFIGPKQ